VLTEPQAAAARPQRDVQVLQFTDDALEDHPGDEPSMYQ
jgi:hypothetical protein